jgi:hypothetical protein
MRILRVFPRRTSYTPADDLAFVGDPPLWRPEPDDFDELHVSVVFSWDVAEGRRLAEAWASIYPDKPVRIGGPALGSPAEGFTPGLYVKNGITFTSRGCYRRCRWCLVPEREGEIRLLDPIPPGWVLCDNNILATPRPHRESVYEMLRQQPRAAVFAGGLQPSLVTDGIAEELKTIRIDQVFLAADTRSTLPELKQAARRLAYLGREKLRCYVLIGYDGESLAEAEERLQLVWKAGVMPFAMLYQPPTAQRLTYAPEWHRLQKIWSRPALMKRAQRSGTCPKRPSTPTSGSAPSDWAASLV